MDMLLDFDQEMLKDIGFQDWELNVLEGNDDDDVTEIMDFNESVNFIIKCKDLDQMELLKEKLSTNSTKMDCVLVFDKSCLNTINKSSITVDKEFIVDSYEQLVSLCTEDNYDRLIKKQKHWHKETQSEKIKIKKELEEIYG